MRYFCSLRPSAATRSFFCSLDGCAICLIAAVQSALHFNAVTQVPIDLDGPKLNRISAVGCNPEAVLIEDHGLCRDLCVAAAALVALKHPVVGLGMCISRLIVYFRPEPPWSAG